MNKFLKFAGAVALSMAAFSASADTIKLVVGYAPGGQVDKIARFAQQTLQLATTKNVVIEYKLGAGSEISTAYVAQNKKNESVFLMQTSTVANHTTSSAYNIVSDLKPVLYLGYSPLVLVANSSYPYKTLNELRNMPADAKLNMGAGGQGTITHANAVAVSNLAKNSVVVPHKGMAEILPTLLSNQINMGWFSLSVVDQHIAAGKLTLVSVAGESRIDKYNTVPTFAEQGFKNITGLWVMILSNTTADPEDIKLVQTVLMREFQKPENQKILREIDLFYEPRQALRAEAILASEIERKK